MQTRFTRRTLLAGSAALLAAPAIVRAQGGALKVGVLLPRSGAQAGIGQDCFRGVELAGPLLKDAGLPDLHARAPRS
jgi:branched-chain amino acid transport system substrate-binding protein